MRKEVITLAVAIAAVSLGLLAYSSYYAANHKDSIASVNPPMNKSISENVTMVPPSDEVTLQVLYDNTSNSSAGNYVLPVHITHKLDMHNAKNGYLAIFPIVPMWQYDPANQEKQYFSLQDEDGKDVSANTFFYREGIYTPNATCESTGENGSMPKQIEAKIGFPMTIPVQSQNSNLMDRSVLYARYNTFGLSSHDNVSSLSPDAFDGSAKDVDSKTILTRYNLTFSSFNNVKIELPRDSNVISRTQSSCVTASDNPTFPAWDVNFYSIVFEVRQKST